MKFYRDFCGYLANAESEYEQSIDRLSQIKEDIKQAEKRLAEMKREEVELEAALDMDERAFNKSKACAALANELVKIKEVELVGMVKESNRIKLNIILPAGVQLKDIIDIPPYAAATTNGNNVEIILPA
jgi:exonuclease VII small subunit